jgi:hypothetical protein
MDNTLPKASRDWMMKVFTWPAVAIGSNANQEPSGAELAVPGDKRMDIGDPKMGMPALVRFRVYKPGIQPLNVTW